jgi:endo-1,4-beta-xylanase
MRRSARSVTGAVLVVLGLVALAAAPASGIVEIPPPDPGFEDVGPDHRFATEIAWMVNAEITDGYDDGTFRPTEPVTRQAMAAFVHRVLNLVRPDRAYEPAPPCTEAPFTDVPADHRFCPEIAWLEDAGYLQGYDDGTFRPTAPVSRQAAAAILHRAWDASVIRVEVTCAGTFPDVPVGHRFCEEIEWMVERGITDGYDDGTFRPTAPVSRQATAAFLMRTFVPN